MCVLCLWCVLQSVLNYAAAATITSGFSCLSLTFFTSNRMLSIVCVLVHPSSAHLSLVFQFSFSLQHTLQG